MSTQTRFRVLAVAMVAYVFWKNYELERRVVKESLRKNALYTWVQTLIYMVRLFPQIAIQRLLGYKTLTSSWWYHEEVAMKIAHFHGMLGNVSVPNIFIGGLTNLGLATSRLAHGVYVDYVPSSELGFGPNSSGRKKFGKAAECSALWITLTGDISYETPGIVKVLYIHGGGFVIGQAGMYINAHAKLLKELKKRGITAGILDVEYPLAPRVKHPVPIDTCIHVYEHLVHEKGVILPEDLVIGGDSAGGIIALNIALRATRWGCAGAMLCSPWVGHGCDTESHQEFAEVDFIGGNLLLEQYQEAHVQGGRDKSVLDQTLDVFKKELPFSALAPVWLSVGGWEVFRDDILKFAQELEIHEVSVELFYGKDVPHIFPMLWPLFIDQSGPALESVADFFVENITRMREETRLIRESLTQEEAIKFKKVLSSTDFASDLVKSLGGHTTNDTNKLKVVLSSGSFADLH